MPAHIQRHNAPAARCHPGQSVFRAPTQAQYIAECIRQELAARTRTPRPKPTLRHFLWEE